MRKSILAITILAFSFFTSCSKNNAPTTQPPPQDTTINFDCIAGSGAEEFIISGDPYGAIPNGYPIFNGYADPSIKKDPNSNTIWFAYSFPHYEQSGSNYVPGVAIHLAKSDDLGNNFLFVKTLFVSTPLSNPANPAQQGYLDHEVINLLPIKNGTSTDWYAARLNYFVPEIGGFAARPNNSFYISIVKANSPENLTTGTIGTIGGNLTDASWNVNTTLIPSDLASGYFFWNEPTLYYDEVVNKMYLVMVAFAYNGAAPDISKNNVYVYSTTPTGNPNTWNWMYNGKLVTQTIANELGGERVTQIEITKGKDGKLLLLCTPDDWVSSQNDFNHKGCKVVEIKSLENPELERNSNGQLKVRAYIKASDANSLGSGSSSYDTNSATGLLFTKRIKTSTQLSASIWKTKIKP